MEVSTGDAGDESNNRVLYVERIGQRKERMKVNTCVYNGKRETLGSARESKAWKPTRMAVLVA